MKQEQEQQNGATVADELTEQTVTTYFGVGPSAKIEAETLQETISVDAEQQFVDDGDLESVDVEQQQANEN